MGKQVDILQGTLDMLILKAVSLGPLHGYGILLRIQQVSKDALQVPQGSLYPALYRLEHRGWIAAEWGESENKRKAKYYRLTAAGVSLCGGVPAGASRLDRRGVGRKREQAQGQILPPDRRGAQAVENRAAGVEAPGGGHRRRAGRGAGGGVTCWRK